jgi:pimeloyl-ACP methyl ester carboxylesterase
MGAYADVNGLRTYFETAGDGHPVLLLRGGVTSDCWLGQIGPLSEHYRVLAPDRRGHGRTADVGGPVTRGDHGAGHGRLPMEKPGLVNQILLDFFAAQQTPRLFPLGALRG